MSLELKSKESGIFPQAHQWILPILAAMLIGLTALQAASAFQTNIHLNHMSGAWATLADDLVNGIFYRPLYDETIGYGGTRYFPIFFTLHALLILLVGDIVRAGYLLSLFCGFSLSGLSFAIFRKIGTPRLYAAVISIFILADPNIQSAIVDIRSDMLPIVFSLAGLYFCLPRAEKAPAIAAEFVAGETLSSYTTGSLIAAAMLFTLSFGAKITSGNGILAALFWLFFLRNQKYSAKRLLLLYLVFMGVFIFTIYAASHGRLLKIFMACASADASLKTILLSPLRILYHTITKDLPLLSFSLFSLTSLLFYLPRKAFRSLLFCYLISSLFVSIVIFGSPGTWLNHLIELHVAVCLFSGMVFAYTNPAHHPHLGALLILACLLSLMPVFQAAQAPYTSDKIQEFEKIQSHINVASDSDDPVLYENPMIPIAIGERVYLQDSFMFRLIEKNRPDMSQHLFHRLRNQQFKAVVLLNNPIHPEWGADWFERAHFGLRFIQILLQYYRIDEKIAGHYILLPK